MSKYLADNQAREVLGREDNLNTQIMEVERILAGVDNAPTLAADDTIVVFDGDDDIAMNATLTFTVGEHDTYIGLVNAYSRTDGASLTYEIVDANVPYTINPRGVISAVTPEGETSPTNTATMPNTPLRISVSDGTNTEIVEVAITVQPAYELVIVQEDATEVVAASVDVEENDMGAMIAVVIRSDEPATQHTDFEIRDDFPDSFNILADKFMIEAVTGSPGTFNLRLKTGEYLDYEAFRTFDLHISALESGTPSNELTITVMVGNVDDISFSGGLRADLTEDVDVQANDELIAEGEVTIANNLDANGNAMPVMVTSDEVTANTSTPGVTTLDFGYGTFTYNHDSNTWSYVVNNEAAAVQALLSGKALTEIVDLNITDSNSIMHTQSIVLNVHGANEDVHYVDTITRNRVDGSDVSIEIGDPAIDGMLDLGNVFDGLTVQNQLAGSTPPTVTFAETDNADVLARQNLFTLSPDGALVFVGNDDDVANLLGQGIALDLVISAPDDTNEPIPFRLSINVVNEDDNGPAAYEIMGEVRENVALSVMRISDDPDTLRGTETYQWFLGDESNPVALLGTGPTYTVTAADLASGETIGVAVSYTDGSGTTYDGVGGNPNPIYAFASPVSFTSPAPGADRRIDLDEDTPANSTAHFTVQATSEDDAGAPVGIASYELLDESRAVVSEYKGFEIHSTTGVITLTGSLDYEMDEVITLRVRATDMNSPAETATLTLTVNVGDVNDNAPIFDPNQVTTVAIDETLGNGQSVGLSVSATDDDGTTANRQVSYSVTGGTGMGIFDVDPSSGVITVLDASMIDYESGTTSYTLIIGASDGLNASGTDDPTFTPDTTTTITINISDVNDIVPTYTTSGSPSVRTTADPAVDPLVSATPTGYSITITDADAGNDFEGNFNLNDPRFEFQDQGNGVWNLVLRANQDITEEAGDTITLTYQVHDGTNIAETNPPAQPGTVTIAVVDSSVSFDAGFDRDYDIPETTSYTAGELVVQVSATSVTPGNPTITYAFETGNPDNALFDIDPTNGRITWAANTAFDYEALTADERIGQVVVIATEVAGSGDTNAGTGNTARVTITGTVMNEQEGDGTYIVEGNVAAGAELTAEVNDPDGTRSVTYEWYSIDPADNNARTVLGATQSITLPDAADFDDSLTYHVDIVHIDNLGDRHEETLDASAVQFNIQKTLTDNTAFPSSIAENTDSLPVVVASLDGDTRTATYTFVGGDTITTSGVFTISQSGSTAGAITVNAPSDINFETAQEFNDGSRGYTLNVRATFAEDTANNLPEVTGDVVVTIIVTDVNEHAPVFVTNADDNTLSTGTEEIAEDAANGTRVGLFRATDADGSNNDVTYSLDDGGLGIFNIRAVDGTNNWEIYVANRTNLDFESATKSYTIEITASDGAEPAMTTTEAFTINITDVNDNDPVLSATPVWEGTLDFGVPENTGTNVHLFTVSATDADENPSLTYEIVSIDGVALASIANPIFGIDASDGRVGLAGQLDRETKASHEIVIRAVDEGGRASNEETFTVTVGDVNDNKPELQEPVWASDYGDNGVPEDAYTGAPLQIFTATATDRDANNGFSYEIVSVDGVTYDSSTSIFSIHAASGRVGITSALDYETAPEIMDDTNTVIGRGHEIVIVAIDNSGTGMRSEPGTITVLVANADDGNATYAITGDVENNGMLSVAVDTADPDGLVAGTESYRWFILNSDGSVPAAGDTNGDVQDAGSDDGDDSTLKLPADVGSNVYGVVVTYRDNAGEMEEETVIASPLRFASSAVEGMIAENSAETVEVATVTATLSTNTAAVPTYSLTDASGKFEISASGVITLKSGQTLDFENTPDFTDGSGRKGYVVTVDATTTDAGKTENAPPATVTIIVTDENDNTPTLAAVSDTKTATIAEDHQRGADVGDISFTITDADADTTNNFTSSSFTITAGTGTSAETAAKFEVVKNGDNWDLKVRATDNAGDPISLDRETDGVLATGVINLDIHVNDGRPTAGDSNVIAVEITVTDVNEFGPVFTETAVTQSIEENAAASPVSNANPATDGDATTSHNTIIYSIVSGNDGGFFSIDGATGVVSTTQALDHESADLLPGGTNRGYVLTLQAVDEGGLQAPEQQTLTIRVVDVNEAPVLGVSGSRTGTMSETDTETGIILTLDDPDAADATIDASRFTFSDARFTVMKVAGQTNQWEVVLKPGESVNYETAADRSIALTVSVTDRATSGMKSNEETITVTVENANDNDPVLVAGSVAWENAFAGGAVAEADYGTGGTKIAQITATDPDRTNDANFGALIYSLTTASTSGYDTYFTLRADGELRVKGDVDFETIANKSFDLEVQVTDATTGGNTDTHTYTVTIDDVNEYDPVISPGAVLWNDPDVTGGAIDEGSYSAGTTIAFATVTDADATNPAPLEFTLTKGGTIFSISNTGVITLKANTDLDADSDPTSYTLAYTVQNVGGNPGGNPIASGDITLTVNNINDNDPEYITGVTTGDPKVIWETGFPGGNILENTAIGTTLGKIQVRDADMDELMFEVVATPDGINTIDSKFEVVYEESTGLGLLKLKTALDLDDPDNPDPSTIALQVIISDEDNDPNPIKNAELSDTGNLILVTIQPVNEHKPALNFSGSTTVNIDEQMPPSNGNGVNTGISFTVDDADSKSYRIDDFDVSGDSRFRVEWSRANQEGSIWLKAGATLDYEKTDPMDPTVFPDRSITLTLTVTDANPVRHSGTDTQTLTINVDPTDDEDPVFNDTHITWNVGALNIRGVPDNTNPTAIAVFERVTVDGTTTGAPAGRKLATLMAADPDTSGALTYGIDNGPQIGGVDIFEIGGANNDELLLKTPLDYEHASVGDIEDDMGNVIARGYTLTLTVSDGRMGVNPVSHKVTIRVLNADEGKAVFAPLTSSGDVTAPAVGDELTFNPTPTTADPDGNPVAPNTFTRTWYRENPDGTGFDTITNASDTYTITSADVGKIVGVIVNYIDGGGTEYLGTAGVKVELANVVVSDFEVTGGTSGMANQYDASAVDATGTLMFGTASAAKVNTAGTYTIVTDGTYGTAEVVDGVWTYNVDNTDAAVKALASGVELEDTFTIGVPLTAAAGGGVQNVDVTVTITGQTASQALGTSGRDTLDRSSATGFEVIQGSDLIDTITVGDHGSLVIGGHGDDEITLGDGVDTVVHRFDSLTDAAWQNDDGQTTIIDFERGKDKLILVDVSNNPVDLATFLDESVSGGITGTNAATDGGMQIKLELNGANITGVIIEIFSTVPEDGPGGTGNNSGTAITVRFKGDGYNISTNMQNRADLLGVGDPDVPAGSPNGFYDSTARWFTDFKTLPLFFDPDGSFDTSNEHFDVIALADLMIDIA